MAWLILSLAVFLGVHSISIVAPKWREEKIATMGENAWKGIYSLISIIALIMMIYFYSQAKTQADILFTPPVWARHLAHPLMLLSFIALMVSNLRAGKLKPVLKHPLLLAIKIWAFSHLLANGDLASVVLFAAFLIWAVIDRISVKRRALPVQQAGPVINDIIAIASAIALWLIFLFWAHEFLMGVSPI